MARICSLEIAFKNQLFPALVSVSENKQDTVFTVHFIESKIRYIEPGDKLVYCQQEGLKQPRNLPPDLEHELNRCLQEWVSNTGISKS